MDKATLVRKLEAANRSIEYVECVLVGGAIVLMAVALGGNFICRNIFNISWTFAEELGSLMLIVLTFAGVSYCARLGRHIRMSIVVDMSPHAIKKMLIISTCLITAFLMFYLAGLGWGWVLKAYKSYKVSSVLRIPLYLVYGVVPLGFFLAGVQYVLISVKNILDPDVVWIGINARDHEAE